MSGTAVDAAVITPRSFTVKKAGYKKGKPDYCVLAVVVDAEDTVFQTWYDALTTEQKEGFDILTQAEWDADSDYFEQITDPAPDGTKTDGQIQRDYVDSL